MMHFIFRQQHKSILSFPELKIDTDFLIITGVNGAGKSHLLEAIEQGNIAINNYAPDRKNIKRMSHTDIKVLDSSSSDPTAISRNKESLLKDIQRHISQLQSNFRTQLIQRKIPNEKLLDLSTVSKWTVSDIQKIIYDEKKSQQIFDFIQSFVNSLDVNIYQYLDDKFKNSKISQLIKEQHLSGIDLDSDIIEENLPLSWTSTNIFQQNYAALFATYHREYEFNKINRYYATQEGEERTWLTEDAFKDRFGEPPWEILNGIFESASLPFQVNRPRGTLDQTFSLELRHTELDCSIRFSDLSSGEQVLVSLVNSLYYSREPYSTSLALPKLLLLDEPDAPLHPAMAKQFIAVVENVLVKQLGLKVIMTTHSPSTIAFAPDNSVYHLCRSPRHLVRVTKDAAIKTLTDGLVTVMPSTKFVIVEAQSDQIRYQKIFDSIFESSEEWQQSSPLVFISASDKEDQRGGGCGQVSNWAGKLSEVGLSNFKGLIDRDKQDENSVVAPSIRILNRYSIENYLLDPVVLYARFIEVNKHQEILDLEEISNCNIYLLSNLSVNKIQDIADAVFGKIEKSYSGLKKSSESFVIEYRNKIKINAPVWLRDKRGHDLVDIVHAAMNNRNSEPIFSKNLKELLLIMEAKLPGFISRDLEEIFIDLAS